MKEIYLDSNATTCVLPAAVAAARQAMEQGYGNPSSTHATGLQAKAMMDGVRQRASGLLGVGDGRLMFNSGATEGIQTAVLSALCALRERRDAGQRIGSTRMCRRVPGPDEDRQAGMGWTLHHFLHQSAQCHLRPNQDRDAHVSRLVCPLNLSRRRNP